MTGNKYDTIICDLGNVLVNFDHRLAVRKILAHTAKKEEDIYNLFFDSPLTALYEEGRIDSRGFFQRIREAIELDIDYENFLPIWNEIFFETSANKKMQEFIKSIKNDFRLIMISNINEAHFAFLKDKMPIFDEFDKIVLSFEAGFRKPAPEIYMDALRSVNSRASSAFYIDDRRDLVEAAGKLGIRGIVFNGEGALDVVKKELKI